MNNAALNVTTQAQDQCDLESDPSLRHGANWYQLSTADVLERFSTSEETGLTEQQVAERRATFGLNCLPDSHQRSPWRIFMEQLQGPMVLLLIIVAIVSVALQEYIDAVAVLAIVLLNSTLGFFQDYRAEQALAALRQLAVPTAKVRREGTTREIASADLVPGDILLIESGNIVGADSRLLEVANLQVMEASLTGESEPVLKLHKPLSESDLIPADRRNMVFQGTTVSVGRGTAIVTETGLRTELGQIASSLQTVHAEPTPLQRRLGQLGVTLAVVAVAIVVIVFFGGILAGEPARLMLLTSLSLAVAIVPEGLPAVATVALASGAKRMASRNALIRRLPAVETLGSVTVICSDKTGTLTQNKMRVTLLDVAGMTHNVRESKTANSKDIDSVQAHSGLSLLLTVGTLCNDSSISSSHQNQQLDCVGDPTELAIVLAASQYGFPKDELESVFPRISEFPFDSDRKCMSTIHQFDSRLGTESQWFAGINQVLPTEDDDYFICAKGAVDEVLTSCSYVWNNDEPIPVDDHWRVRIQHAQADLARRGMRVLGIAFKLTDDFRENDPASIESDLIFLGLVAMIDPPRE